MCSTYFCHKQTEGSNIKHKNSESKNTEKKTVKLLKLVNLVFKTVQETIKIDENIKHLNPQCVLKEFNPSLYPRL